jgi:PAS domain S-box-containing protein
LSNHETHDIIPTLAQAFDAFNKSADKLSVAYKQLVAKDIEPMAQSGELSSSPLLLGALECVPGGVIVIDREYSVVAVNTAAQELTGLSANDVAGEFCQDVFENTLKTGTSKRRRKRMSSDIEVEIHTSPVADNNGNIIGAVGILGQQGQSSLPRVAPSPRHSLAPMLTAIGDIIMNIAHRMRSPLNAIQLFAELLKQDLDEDKQEMVDDILIGV